jgi:hypothetical protein
MRTLLHAGLALVCCYAEAAVTIRIFNPSPNAPALFTQVPFDLDADSLNDGYFIRDHQSLRLYGNQPSALRILSYQSDTYTLYPIDLGGDESIGPQPVRGATWFNEFIPNGIRFGYALASELYIDFITGEAYQFGLFTTRPLTIPPDTYTAFLGFELTKPDGIHYGYMEMQMITGGTFGRLLSIGYETTPGVPIITQFSPEPRVALLLALGGLGVLLRRRRAEMTGLGSSSKVRLQHHCVSLAQHLQPCQCARAGAECIRLDAKTL